MTGQSQFKPKNKILLHQHIFKFKTWWVSTGRCSSLIGRCHSHYSATTTVLTHQVFRISLAYCCHVTKLSSLIGWAAETLHNDPQNRVRVRVRFPVKSPFRYKLQATISTSGSMFRCYCLLVFLNQQWLLADDPFHLKSVLKVQAQPIKKADFDTFSLLVSQL